MTTVSVKNGRDYTVTLGALSDEEIDHQYESQQILKAAQWRGLEIDCAILELPVLVTGVEYKGSMGTIDLEESRAIFLNILLFPDTDREPSAIHCLLTKAHYEEDWQLHDKIVLEYGDDTDFVGRTFVQKLKEFTR